MKLREYIKVVYRNCVSSFTIAAASPYSSCSLTTWAGRVADPIRRVVPQPRDDAVGGGAPAASSASSAAS